MSDTQKMVSVEYLAQKAYEAYSASTGNKNFRGEEMPKFDDLPQAIKDAWAAAVNQVVIIVKG